MLNETSDKDPHLSGAIMTAMAQSVLMGYLARVEDLLNTVQIEAARSQSRVTGDMEELQKSISVLERQYAGIANTYRLHPIPPLKIVSGKIMKTLGMIGFAIALSFCAGIYDRARVYHDPINECVRARAYGQELYAWARHAGLVEATHFLAEPRNPSGCPAV